MPLRQGFGVGQPMDLVRLVCDGGGHVVRPRPAIHPRPSIRHGGVGDRRARLQSHYDPPCAILGGRPPRSGGIGRGASFGGEWPPRRGGSTPPPPTPLIFPIFSSTTTHLPYTSPSPHI